MVTFCYRFVTTNPIFSESSPKTGEFLSPRGVVKENYRARIVFNGRRELVSDIVRLIGRDMDASNKIVLAPEILVFDRELLIAGRCECWQEYRLAYRNVDALKEITATGMLVYDFKLITGAPL